MAENSRIVVHHSGGEWGHASIIEQWHAARWGHLVAEGKPRIGYHAVILNGYPTHSHAEEKKRIDMLDGSIELGRPLDTDDDIEAWEEGAHAYGYNKNTLGVCLIGINTFTRPQLTGLLQILTWWSKQFRIPVASIVGHKELWGVKTDCPSIDMELIRSILRNWRTK